MWNINYFCGIINTMDIESDDLFGCLFDEEGTYYDDNTGIDYPINYMSEVE